jgi:hypothetical protein
MCFKSINCDMQSRVNSSGMYGCEKCPCSWETYLETHFIWKKQEKQCFCHSDVSCRVSDRKFSSSNYYVSKYMFF